MIYFFSPTQFSTLQGLPLCNEQSGENNHDAALTNVTDSRRNHWKLYGRHHEPVGLFLLVPAVHTKHTVVNLLQLYLD